MHRVRFFGARCNACRRAFPVPLLGDMSYGLFILTGDQGDVFGYLDAFENCPWGEIRSRLEVLASPEVGPLGDDDRFRAVIAGCADKIHSQPLTMKFVCPACRSRDVSFGDSHPLHDGEIPVVSFTEFLALDDAAKTRRIMNLWTRAREAATSSVEP